MTRDSDLNKLQQALTEREAENRRLRVINALGDVLPKHNADPLLTRAVLRDKGVLDDLDPDDDGFADKLDAAIKAAVDVSPKLTIEPEPPTSQPEATDPLSAHYSDRPSDRPSVSRAERERREAADRLPDEATTGRLTALRDDRHASLSPGLRLRLGYLESDQQAARDNR